MTGTTPIVRSLGLQSYTACLQAMREFTARRAAGTPDECWLVQHPAVYTLGRNAKAVPPTRSDIPVIETDRGGDITYHAPGQIVLYALLDLTQRGIGVKRLVQALEQSVIDLLAAHAVDAKRRSGAPGVYVADAKIAALGLRVTRGCSYHGLALNVDMDLAPFGAIAPCGYADLRVTQLRDLGIEMSPAAAGDHLMQRLAHELGTMPVSPRARNSA